MWIIGVEKITDNKVDRFHVVIAAMLEDDNKRFLISFYQHGRHVFVIWFSRDWLQTVTLYWKEKFTLDVLEGSTRSEH